MLEGLELRGQKLILKSQVALVKSGLLVGSRGPHLLQGLQQLKLLLLLLQDEQCLVIYREGRGSHLRFGEFLGLRTVHLTKKALGQRGCLAGRFQNWRGGVRMEVSGVVGLSGGESLLLLGIESSELLELSDLTLQLLELTQKHGSVACWLRLNHGKDGLRLCGLRILLKAKA